MGVEEPGRPGTFALDKRVQVALRLRKPTRGARLLSFFGWFLGVMPQWSAFLDQMSQEYPILKVLDFIDYTFRGIGQVGYANNSLTGILILAGLLVSGHWTGLMGFVGAFAGTLTGVIIGDRGLLRAGLYGYNGNLVGIGLATFLSPQWWPPTIVVVVFASALSSFLFISMSRVLKTGLPGLTWGFNISAIVMLSALFGSSYIPTDPILISPRLPTQTWSVGEPFDIVLFIQGTVKGVSQVWFAGELLSAILILAGLALCSPLLCVLCLCGSLVANLTMLALGAPYALIYSGVAGFNAVLCMPAISAVFCVLQLKSVLVGVFTSMFSVVMFLALRTFFSAVSMPTFTFPFCITTTAVLLLRGPDGAPPLGLIPIPLAYVTTPEAHLYRAARLRQLVARWLARSRFRRNRLRSVRSAAPSLSSRTRTQAPAGTALLPPGAAGAAAAHADGSAGAVPVDASTPHPLAVVVEEELQLAGGSEPPGSFSPPPKGARAGTYGGWL